jgi:hypothetical protein
VAARCVRDEEHAGADENSKQTRPGNENNQYYTNCTANESISILCQTNLVDERSCSSIVRIHGASSFLL